MLRLKLFWKIGLPYLFLLLVVLAAVNFYTARVLEERFLRDAYEQLDSISNLVESRPPRLDDPVELQEWADWMAESGAQKEVPELLDLDQDPGLACTGAPPGAALSIRCSSRRSRPTTFQWPSSALTLITAS